VTTAAELGRNFSRDLSNGGNLGRNLPWFASSSPGSGEPRGKLSRSDRRQGEGADEKTPLRVGNGALKVMGTIKKSHALLASFLLRGPRPAPSRGFVRTPRPRGSRNHRSSVELRRRLSKRRAPTPKTPMPIAWHPWRKTATGARGRPGSVIPGGLSGVNLFPRPVDSTAASGQRQRDPRRTRCNSDSTGGLCGGAVYQYIALQLPGEGVRHVHRGGRQAFASPEILEPRRKQAAQHVTRQPPLRHQGLTTCRASRRTRSRPSANENAHRLRARMTVTWRNRLGVFILNQETRVANAGPARRPGSSRTTRKATPQTCLHRLTPHLGCVQVLPAKVRNPPFLLPSAVRARLAAL